MFDFDNEDFNGNRTMWTRFWTTELDGKPLWYVAAMAAVSLHVGLLLSQLLNADAVLAWILAFMIAGGALMLWLSLRRK